MGSGARHEFCCDASYEGWSPTCKKTSTNSYNVIDKAPSQMLLSVLPGLQKIGQEHHLSVSVGDYDTVTFHTLKGRKYIYFSLSDYSELSMYRDNLEYNYTDEDLSLLLKIMNAVGYKVGNDYKAQAKKAFGFDPLDTTVYFPPGLKIEMINHGNELRQFISGTRR
jgi:hypothetical protein